MLQIWLEPTEQMDIVDKHLSATLPEQFAAGLASGIGLVYKHTPLLNGYVRQKHQQMMMTKQHSNGTQQDQKHQQKQDETATTKWSAIG